MVEVVNLASKDKFVCHVIPRLVHSVKEIHPCLSVHALKQSVNKSVVAVNWHTLVGVVEIVVAEGVPHWQPPYDE